MEDWDPAKAAQAQGIQQFDWDPAKAAQAQGIQQLGCIKFRRADRVYKREKRQKEDRERMRALASRYERLFQASHPFFGTSHTGSQQLPSRGSSYHTSVTDISTIETSTKMEIDDDTSIKSEDSKVKGEIIPYLFCLSCGIPRNFNLVYSGICVYCTEEKKYCIYGDHEEDRPDFVDRHGIEQLRCNNCRDDSTGSDADSSHEKVKSESWQEDQLLVGNESQMDDHSQADSKPELEVPSQLGIEPRMDIEPQADTDSQTALKSQLDEEPQLDDEPLDDEPPDDGPLDDEPLDDEPLDDEPQPDTETSPQTQFHFPIYTTMQSENEPVIQVSDVKAEPLTSVDMNNIPQFLISSVPVQGTGNFSSPICIDSD
ncbi:hypothetical protein N7486_002815 [Penicillium sp. IBT 16267x]|nr:hypothetical protein N7486_002815 [Penicillium sp. IBT 16267x]